MSKLLSFFLQRKLIVYLLTLMILFTGFASLASFKVFLVPKTNLPWIIANISGGSLPPEEMEKKVAERVEKEVKGMEEVKDYFSSSSSGNVQITLVAKEGKGEVAKQKLESIINRERTNFPKEVEHSNIYQANYGDETLMVLALTGNDPQSLYNYAQDTLKERIEAVAGVKGVEISKGSFENKIAITLLPERLSAYQVTPAQIYQELQKQNWKQALGTLDNAGYQTVIELDKTLHHVEELKSVMIPTPRGMTLLSQLATVKDLRGSESDQSLAIYKGKPYIGISIKRTEGSEIIPTQTRVEQLIAQINQDANGIYHLTSIFEAASFIEHSISNLSRDVTIGGALAILILFVFLRNWRVTMVIATTLPLSILMTFIALKVFGYNFDMVTLISLSLSVGLIVDAAIVVLESIYHYREQGKALRESILLGTKEVLTPVLSSQITMVVVFLPLVLAGFDEALTPIFTTIAFTVTAAIVSATIVSIFFVPIFSDSFLKNDKQKVNGENHKDNLMVRWFDRVLHLCLRRRFVTLGLAFLMFCSIFVLAPHVKTNLGIDVNENFIFADISLPHGTSLEGAKQVISQTEEKLATIKEIKDAYIGGNLERLQLQIALLPRAERSLGKEEIGKQVMEKTKEVTGVERFSFSTDSPDGGAVTVEVEISGKDLEKAKELSEQVSTMLVGIEGISSVRNDFSEGKEKITLVPIKEAMNRLQVDERVLAQHLSSMMGEQKVAELTTDGTNVDVMARFPEQEMKHPEQLKKMLIPTQNQTMIPLVDVVEWKYGKTPQKINHRNGERVIKVSADLVGIDPGNATRLLQTKLDQLVVPAGLQVELAGSLKDQENNMSSALFVFLGAIACIYLIMVAQFGRLSHPFIIMLTLPMAGVGVVMGLVLTQRMMTAMSIIGVIMLIGIVVSNAILLIDRINLLRKRGIPLQEAIIKGTHDRVRPVLMTKITAILGMVPMALAFGDGASLEAPLATVVIAGLIFHTLVTLVLVPVLYSVFEGIDNWWNNKREKRMQKRLKRSIVATSEGTVVEEK
ncbi:efflux RND transporter permease subunit [Brevibacillus laterosporus]|uniref:efflux RND transporter permease subunit n=1 Tax=Brevibacillus laterosporus TaxID=1465 RepID=UPI003D20B27F